MTARMSLLIVFSLLLFPSFSDGRVQPCWLQTPQLNEQLYGYIGTAAKYSQTRHASIMSSRTKALAQLAEYEGLTLPNLTPQQVLQTKISIDDRQLIFFDEYERDGTLYSFVVPLTDGVDESTLQQWQQQQCHSVQCDFTACSPAWLCGTQLTSSNRDIVGVSNLTARPQAQLQKAKDNANTILNYLMASAVDASSELTQSYQNGNFGIAMRERQKVTQVERVLPLRPIQQCWGQNFVFSWFRSQQPLSLTANSKPFQQWLMDPSFGDQIGVVGVFDGYESTGRVSNRIELAIKNGLVEIAKSKKIRLQASDLIVSKTDGLYVLTNIKTKVNTQVSAKLLDIVVKEIEDKLIIYTWLLPS